MELNLELLISAVAVIISFVSLAYSLVQQFRTTKIGNAQFFKEIVDKLWFDEEIIDAMDAIDFDENWYNDEFPKSDFEWKIDKLFSCLSYICYLYNSKIISKTEFGLLEYKVKRACQSPSTQKYLKFLYWFSKATGNTKHTYEDLIEYMFSHVYNNDKKLINSFKYENDFKLKRDVKALNFYLNSQHNKERIEKGLKESA